MAGLILAYFLLAAFVPSHMDFSYLLHVDYSAIWIAVPVMITSFGFHIIIPTLTTYLHHDKKKLRIILFLGSLVPLVVYLFWEFLVLGTVPLEGLISSWSTGQTGAFAVSQVIENKWITSVSSTFAFFAIVTSFLGVSLSLSDFLTDGLKMRRFSLGREFASLLTFIPPLIFVLVYQRGFIIALQYAGIFVAILLCILPALMAWTLPTYRSLLRRGLLLAVILLSIFVIALDILEEVGYLKTLVLNVSVKS